jgi:hypothetical protein
MARAIMPPAAAGPLDLTILRAPGRRLTKRITATGTVGYDCASLFEPQALRLDRLDDLAAVLTDLEAQPDRCVIRAVLKPEFADRQLVLRRLHDRPDAAATFVEVPRAWAMLDLEPAEAPGVDPTSPAEAGGWLRQQLPAPFQAARCVVQLSSGAGVKPGLRAHLWYLLDRPLVRAELEQWLRGVPGLDLAPFRAIQVHYTARPWFDGVDDPCVNRLAVLLGLEAVAVPAVLSELAPKRSAPRRSAPRTPSVAWPAAPYVAPARGLTFRATRPEQYMLGILHNLTTAPPGERHNALIPASCRLFELVKAGQLDGKAVVRRVLGVARPWADTDGDLDEVRRILEWAWQTVSPKGLPR